MDTLLRLSNDEKVDCHDLPKASLAMTKNYRFTLDSQSIRVSVIAIEVIRGIYRIQAIWRGSILEMKLGFCETSNEDKTYSLSRKRVEAIPDFSPKDKRGLIVIRDSDTLTP